jgi:antitoxin (DNA-binding transcriptional repressor) of toxin-antitoxin stability system
MRLYTDDMKTLSVTDARQNLTRWLQAAMAGEDVGILCGNQVVALRPVQVYSEDYALQEYGLTKKGLTRAAKRMDAELAADKKRGRLRRYSGDLERDLSDT